MPYYLHTYRQVSILHLFVLYIWHHLNDNTYSNATTFVQAELFCIFASTIDLEVKLTT